MANVIPQDSTTGAKAQNAEFFASDLAPKVDAQHTSKFKVTVSMLNDALQMTLDSGTTWVTLGTPAANTKTEYEFSVRNGDTVNFRTPDVGGTTLDFFRVDEILAEG